MSKKVYTVVNYPVAFEDTPYTVILKQAIRRSISRKKLSDANKVKEKQRSSAKYYSKA